MKTLHRILLGLLLAGSLVSGAYAHGPRVGVSVQFGYPVYYAPPVRYVPPPTYYAPPPVYYAPSPAVYWPGSYPYAASYYGYDRGRYWGGHRHWQHHHH